MSFVSAFDNIKHFNPLKTRTCDIDNVIFKLHYRFTVCLLLVATILVTSRQYIGEHIRCLSDAGVPENVMNTYCFFTTTFTVTKEMNADRVDKHQIPHPGIGNHYIGSTEPIVKHAYYQWVPFVLFGQALMFYLTHLLWKKLEGNRIKALATGLEAAAFSILEKELNITEKKNGADVKINIPSKEEKDKKIAQIRQCFMNHVYINSSWAVYLILCEILNLLHVILQFFITNKFLNGQFSDLGPTMIREGVDSSVSVLEEVFPKITKCTFHKYGPSGSIQLHDAMCVMALNIINEKIYGFLWFWFIFLFIVSALALLWRTATIVLHARSRKFNQLVFSNSCPGKMNPWNNLSVSRHCSYTDWLFLKYLSKNVDGLVFREIFMGIAQDLEGKHKLLDLDEY